jgi:ribokinase
MPPRSALGRVVVAGSINMDIAAAASRFPQPGETVAGTGLAFHPGGKGANQAVAAAKLGARTLLIGRIGRDAFGAQLLSFLVGEGVDVRHVHEVDAATGTAVVTTVGSANTIVVMSGANGLLDAVGVDAEPIQPGDVLLSQFEIPGPAIRHFFTRGRLAGATTILNPSPAAQLDDLLLDQSDIVVLNETELAWFSSQPLSDSFADAEIVAAARMLRQRRQTQVICVTLGARGVLALGGEQVITVGGRNVTAIDTTGAGDCFTGALAASLAKGCDLATALNDATDAAAVSVTRLGAGPSMPTPADIAALRARKHDAA